MIYLPFIFVDKKYKQMKDGSRLLHGLVTTGGIVNDDHVPNNKLLLVHMLTTLFF